MQTDKVLKRHMKLGVNSQKLGIMKDKDTNVDMRTY